MLYYILCIIKVQVVFCVILYVEYFYILKDKNISLCVGTKGVSHNHRLSFDDNKVLKLSIGYAKHLFKCPGP